jgi:hypothetical protein
MIHLFIFPESHTEEGTNLKQMVMIEQQLIYSAYLLGHGAPSHYCNIYLYD